MVKFGKNKFKALNRMAKQQKSATNTNKVLKKKLNIEKKLSFQKEVLIKEVASGSGDNSLVQNVSAKKIQLDELIKKDVKKQPKPENTTAKPKVKSVERHKKRQKTQINDTKLLLNLMKKK